MGQPVRILVIQAHLDDAFFSVTETAMTWVEDGHDVHLLTVFGGVPPVGHEHHVKYITLWQEYEAAIERGPFEHAGALDYFDDAARTDQLMWADFQAAVRQRVTKMAADATVWPTGIHHPDHLLTSGCRRDGGWAYDELPYYVLYPNEALEFECDDWTTQVGKWDREGSRDHLAAKQRICRLFGSQMGPSLERTLWAPERVWRPA
jgi:hypothetical protein